MMYSVKKEKAFIELNFYDEEIKITIFKEYMVINSITFYYDDHDEKEVAINTEDILNFIKEVKR